MRLADHPDLWVRRWVVPLGALFLALCLLLGAWSLSGCEAHAQQPPLDPQAQALVQALEHVSKSQGGLGDLASPLAILLSAVIGVGGLGWAAPKLGRDESAAATLARIDERTRATRRELRQLRATVQWQGSCLTAVAGREGVQLPPAPQPDNDDSDEP